VKRTSAAAVAIVEAVNRPEVTGRWLERQSQAGLLPPPGTPAEAVHRHVNAVADLNPAGRDPDRMAFMLAGRGFGCVRLPAALVRAYSQPGPVDSTEHPATLQTWTDATSDDVAVIETRVGALLGVLDVRSRTVLVECLQQLARTVDRNAASDPVRDALVDLPESPAATLRAALADTMRLLSGGELMEAESVSRLADADGRMTALDDRRQEAVDMFATVGPVAERFAATLAELSPDTLAVGAKLARHLLDAAGVGKMIGGPERLDLLAGILAPFGLAMFPMLVALGMVEVGLPAGDISAGTKGAADVD
jgi:hypothetical protein